VCRDAAEASFEVQHGRAGSTERVELVLKQGRVVAASALDLAPGRKRANKLFGRLRLRLSEASAGQARNAVTSARRKSFIKP